MSFSPEDLALSTCWASGERDGAAAILERMASTGLERFELDYRITGKDWAVMQPELKARGLTPVSIHNFFPHPDALPPETASGDLFNLASLNGGERRKAVEYTVRTLEIASDLEVPVVVLHLGWVEGAEDKEALKEAARAGEITPALAANLEMRAKLAPKALDEVSFSLERLACRAGPLGVRLGLENRFHAFELPSLEEAELLLRKRFAGAPMGHWHDLGHSTVQGLAGLAGTRDWLERFGDELEGCHLHDVQGIEDHLAPGQGGLDWDWAAGAFLKAPLKVMEIHSGPDPDQVARAAEMLAGVFSRAQTQKRGQKAAARIGDISGFNKV